MRIYGNVEVEPARVDFPIARQEYRMQGQAVVVTYCVEQDAFRLFMLTSDGTSVAFKETFQTKRAALREAWRFIGGK